MVGLDWGKGNGIGKIACECGTRRIDGCECVVLTAKMQSADG